jgi:hypothetical protein
MMNDGSTTGCKLDGGLEESIAGQKARNGLTLLLVSLEHL